MQIVLSGNRDLLGHVGCTRGSRRRKGHRREFVNIVNNNRFLRGGYRDRSFGSNSVTVRLNLLGNTGEYTRLGHDMIMVYLRGIASTRVRRGATRARLLAILTRRRGLQYLSGGRSVRYASIAGKAIYGRGSNRRRYRPCQDREFVGVGHALLAPEGLRLLVRMTIGTDGGVFSTLLELGAITRVAGVGSARAFSSVLLTRLVLRNSSDVNFM